MSGKSTSFDDKKINKSNFYKNKNLFSLNNIDVNKVSYGKKKKNHMVQKIHLNTSLDIIMVML